MTGFQRQLKQAQAVILDGDGVLWRGNEPLPGLRALFDFFTVAGLPFVLATNNSTRTVQDYIRKLAGFGITAGPDNVVTSATATADYLRAHYDSGLRVHVVGEAGLHQILLEAGFPVNMVAADVVVAGMDRDITYEKLRRAATFIRNGARFIGTNGDLTFPMPDGLAPGAGTVLAALEAASGQAPFVIGKPAPTMFEMALSRLGVAPDRAIMIGDRLETDILGGQRAGMSTALVMSGVTTPEILAESEIQPDAVFEDLRDLLAAWQEVSSTDKAG